MKIMSLILLQALDQQYQHIVRPLIGATPKTASTAFQKFQFETIRAKIHFLDCHRLLQ